MSTTLVKSPSLISTVVQKKKPELSQQASQTVTRGQQVTEASGNLSDELLKHWITELTRYTPAQVDKAVESIGKQKEKSWT